MILNIHSTQFPFEFTSHNYIPLPSIASAPSSIARSWISLRCCSGADHGPRSAPSSNPPLTLGALARVDNSGSQYKVSPTMTRHYFSQRCGTRCPAAPKQLPRWRSARCLTIAVSCTAAWFITLRGFGLRTFAERCRVRCIRSSLRFEPA